MTDISKCSGEGCPLKDSCRRYTAPASEWQYWIEPNWDGEECVVYLEESRDPAEIYGEKIDRK